MRIERKTLVSTIVVAGLIVMIISLNGCKKSEPSTTQSSNQQMAQTGTPTTPDNTTTVEQTICPVMGEPINKDIYVEFLGKKVYFCCEDCQEKFMEDPEKYLDKLPQFKK